MSNLFYGFHSLIRRNISMLERLLVATGLAVVIYSLTQSIRVYPQYWDVVIIGVVFLLTLWSPVAGYFLAVLAACYPLFTISIYVAVLFLAIAVIGQHIFIQNLSATLLTLASPLLGGIYLAWIIPLLGGLWWGPAGGALMGALAALWGQLFAGMAGLSPDWLNLLGILPDVHFSASGFSSANSLETLRLLFAPFFPNPTTLLYYVLQIASWAFTGWLVGMLTGKEWAQYHRPRATIALVATGAPLLALLHVLPALWLGFPLRPQVWENLGYATICSALVAMLLEAGAYFFEHPVPLPKPRAARLRENRVPTSPPAPLPPANLPPMDTDDKSEDLIMLELD
jgi:hypothetical protein